VRNIAAMETPASPYRCFKHQIDVDPNDLRCRDPHLFCKFRPSCTVYFLAKEAAAGADIDDGLSDWLQSNTDGQRR
jgi:hypothetical protein